MHCRRKFASLFLSGLLVFSLLAGCSAKNSPAENFSDSSWDTASAEPEYLGEWPDNKFTEKIPLPQSGTLDYVLDYTDSGRYAIFIKDISSTESDQYISELKNAGYSKVHSDESKVSVGIALTRSDAYLSVSYSENELGILITLQERID